MKRNIKLILEYDGTKYSGWQYQINANSIQEILEKAISKVIDSKINLISAGRTDAGVHAKGQVANFKAETSIPLWNLKEGINSLLPYDIHIKSCEDESETFNARFDAKKKFYRYIVSREYSPFNRLYTYLYTFKFSVDILKEAAAYLIGTHDFKSFMMTTDENIRTIRTVDKIEIIEDAELIYFDFEAASYLHNMIRIITGTLLKLSRENKSPSVIKNILLSKNRFAAGPTAPGRGLFLMKVYY